MVFDGRCKYIHVKTVRPILYDLRTDPNELHDLATDPAYAEQLTRLAAMHYEWSRRHHNRITRGAATIERMTDEREPPGIIIGYANRKELEDDGLTMPPHKPEN